jgi:hypothetical protein
MKDNKHIQSFNEHQENLNISDVSDSELNIGDNVITNLIGYENSPFHKVKGVVVEITGNDYLLDMTPNGEDFVKHWKDKGNLYGCDWNTNIPKTCKWFEKQQLIKV